jgi:hypothetical protein
VKVLVIPEDQELDRYIVKPVVEALFRELDVRARVDVLPEPRLRGAAQALDPAVVREIVEDNPMVDLFLLVVDADCDRDGNKGKASRREREHPGKLIACLAVQELEVWMLALHKERIGARFSDVRKECDPKERWAEPLLEAMGTDSPGGGRQAAMREIRGSYKSLRDTCKELGDLERAIRVWLAGRRGSTTP